MAEETQYTAQTGIVQIATANSALDGTGTRGTIITAASNGTLIKNLYIKSTGTTAQGMVRIFVTNTSGVTTLLTEIAVPAITQASIRPTFEVVLPLNYNLQANCVLSASTQIANTFNVIAEALNWAYYSSSVRTDTTKYNPQFSSATMATANSNLNGTGTLATPFVAGSSATYKGASVSTINLKATVADTPGMVRLYVYNGTTSYLFKEVIIPAHAISGTDKSFEHTIDFDGNDFDLQAGYQIRASTQNAQNFNMIGEGNNWSYYS